MTGKIVYPWTEPPSEGEVIEVAEGVLWARLPLPMALDHVNVYALDDQDRPPPETLDYWRSAGMAADILDQRATERPFNFADVVHPLPLGFTRLSENNIIKLNRHH